MKKHVFVYVLPVCWFCFFLNLSMASLLAPFLVDWRGFPISLLGLVCSLLALIPCSGFLELHGCSADVFKFKAGFLRLLCDTLPPIRLKFPSATSGDSADNSSGGTEVSKSSCVVSVVADPGMAANFEPTEAAALL